MSCDKYWRFWMGELSQKDFVAHRASCEECRSSEDLDVFIAHQAQELPVPTSAPGLWNRIAAEISLQQATARQARSRPMQMPVLRRLGNRILDPRHHLVWKLAALLVVTVGTHALLSTRAPDIGPTPHNLLTAQALSRVEALETEYEQAITELETLAAPMIAEADTGLLLHYRERLETIDRQIRRCRAVLAHDGVNAHVRRYLLAAYQDKKETLTELLTLVQGQANATG
jgi:hypothetical protein